MKNTFFFLLSLLYVGFTQMLSAQAPGNGVTDIDGNYYPSVIIGTQEWLAENLKVSHYNNGESIIHKTDSLNWDDGTDGAWCYYKNDILNNAEYGKLYNWFAVNDSRGICPRGWKIPADSEWDILVNFLGGAWAAGGKIKEAGSSHWNTPNNGATNISGLTALPGGMRDFDGTFADNNSYGYFWSTWQNHPTTRHRWELRYYQTLLAPFNVAMGDGYSCRCIKSLATATTDHTSLDMKLYPNPVQDQLTITLLPDQAGFSFKLTDLLGHVLITGDLKNLENTLNLSDLNTGIYILIYGSGSKLIIKQ